MTLFHSRRKEASFVSPVTAEMSPNRLKSKRKVSRFVAYCSPSTLEIWLVAAENDVIVSMSVLVIGPVGMPSAALILVSSFTSGKVTSTTAATCSVIPNSVPITINTKT